MKKLNKWENLTMGELENLIAEIVTGKQILYQVGNHKLESTFDEEAGLLRTVYLDTLEIIESEKDEWSFSDLLQALAKHLLMTADD